VVVGFLCLTGWAGWALGQPNAASPREAAVLQARAGRVDYAINALQAQLAAGSPDPLVAMDLVTLLQQHQRPAEAVAIFARTRRDTAPDYALLAVTRANRDLGRFNDAAELARLGMRRFPGDPVWTILLALILTDAGQPAQALTTLRLPQAKAAPPEERLLAEAYALRALGDEWGALRSYSQASLAAPGNKEARAGTAEMLRRLHGPFGAAAQIGLTPSLAADQAASIVRWGSDIPPRDPTLRFVNTDAALARLDELIGQAQAASKPDPALLRRLRLDRMIALRDRLRMAEVVAEADALRRDSDLPAFVQEALGDALLNLRRPEDARLAYEVASAADPSALPPRYGLFYSAVESEDFAAAYAIADGILASQYPWNSYLDSPRLYPNTDYPTAALIAGQARIYGNQPAEGIARITPVADGAPANQSARLAAAEAMNARGWPRAADTETQIAASLQPSDFGAQIAQADMALARYRLAEASARIETLSRVYPENLGVRRLSRELDAINSFELDFRVKPSGNTGGGVNDNGREIESTLRLFSPPIHNMWRIFTMAGYANARPPEGYVRRELAGAGLELRLTDLTSTLFATQSGGTLVRGGGGFTTSWTPDDHVRLGVSGQLFSIETPLRALLHGITANEIGVQTGYSWNDARAVSASLAFLPFSDSNQRTIGSVGFSQKLLSLPHLDLIARADAHASSNTRIDAPYYNPRSDLSVTAGLTVQHILWRRYDRSLTQVLDVDAGGYGERNYRGGWIGAISYEQRWRFDPYKEFYYGTIVSRRLYDGDPSNSLAFLFGFRLRI